MDAELKRKLILKANELIDEITSKKLSQVEISQLIGISPTTLSKLKSAEYFPKNGDVLIQKLEELSFNLKSDPKKVFETLLVYQEKGLSLRRFKIAFISFLVGFILCACLYFFFKKNNMDSEIPIEKAFNAIFESEMQTTPYSKDTELPCYKYQKKWTLDDESPYTIVLELLDGIYYYRSKSVDFYAWCGNDKGDRLDALELFTNELWKDEEKRNDQIDSLRNGSLSKETGFTKLAEISSVFSDVIHFDSIGIKKRILPYSREGRRIARYFKTDVNQDNENEVMLIVKDYISKLSKTECHSIKVIDNKSNSSDISMTIEFNCTFFKNENDNMPPQSYKKILKK